MAALTAYKNIPREGMPVRSLDLPVKAAVKIFQGAIVVIDSSGYAAPATTALGSVCVGIAQHEVDNTSGANGALRVGVEAGVFRKITSGTAGDALVQADSGDVVYLIDDQTVGKTDGTGTRSKGGVLIRVDSDGLVVQLGVFGVGL